IYFDGEMFYHKTNAVLRIARKLRFPFPLFYGLIVFPPFIRNAVYDFIAKYRYVWFGKRESCMIPQPQWKQRFLG
ncbi:MAG TPA: DCC1-like thiol-disulfide oxidoreductase family protein, partial [Chitinophagales bacterium]|nr:DCC1-like thiol-disulfide oxidoreductase family protein [Chitinophagales bacterium]